MNPLRRPVRKTERLHRGRISISGARYFVTMVALDRKPWLASATARAAALASWQSWHVEKRGHVLAATVMPDHAHVLFELGADTTVGQAAARWKTETRKGMGFAEGFQRDFWEHRLREADNVEDYALYLFLNPYRAGLIATGEAWRGWWSPDPRMFRFPDLLDERGAPPQEWIDWPDDRFAGVAHGE